MAIAVPAIQPGRVASRRSSDRRRPWATGTSRASRAWRTTAPSKQAAAPAAASTPSSTSVSAMCRAWRVAPPARHAYGAAAMDPTPALAGHDRFAIGFDHRDRPALHAPWDEILHPQQWAGGGVTPPFQALWGQRDGTR